MIRLLPFLVLGACASARQPPVSQAGSGVCSAEGLANLVGQPATSDLAADALDRSGARSLRWLQPGMAVTMDYRRDRLDIHLDASNRVTRITCG
jgi:hypothetical protein